MSKHPHLCEKHGFIDQIDGGGIKSFVECPLCELEEARKQIQGMKVALAAWSNGKHAEWCASGCGYDCNCGLSFLEGDLQKGLDDFKAGRTSRKAVEELLGDETGSIEAPIAQESCVRPSTLAHVFPCMSVEGKYEPEGVAQRIMQALALKGDVFRILSWEEYRDYVGRTRTIDERYFLGVVDDCASEERARAFSGVWNKTAEEAEKNETMARFAE